MNIELILELTPSQLKERLAASAESRSALMPSGYLTVDWITYPVGDVDKVSLYFSPVHIITRNSEEPEDLRLDFVSQKKHPLHWRLYQKNLPLVDCTNETKNENFNYLDE